MTSHVGVMASHVGVMTSHGGVTRVIYIYVYVKYI